MVFEKGRLQRRAVGNEVVEFGGSDVTKAALTVEMRCHIRAPRLEFPGYTRRHTHALLVAAEHLSRLRSGHGSRHRGGSAGRKWSGQ